MLVDITPGVNQEKAAEITAFVDGPPEFESFDALLERTMAFNPTRSRSSLRRGVLHNARERDDGTWVWRYDQLGDRLDRPRHPVRSTCGRPCRRVDRARSRWCRAACRRWSTTTTWPSCAAAGPTPRSIVVDAAGHSIQGDQPVELARILDGIAST